MSIVMIMKWDGVSIDQYDQIRTAVNWEGDHPAGGIAHVVTHDGSALRITDVWESVESFETFSDDRLNPGVATVGIDGEPDVEIYPLHALFTPGLMAQT